VITNKGGGDDIVSGVHNRRDSQRSPREKGESEKKFLGICAANMAVCQDIAAVSLRCARRANPLQKRRVEAEKTRGFTLHTSRKTALDEFYSIRNQIWRASCTRDT